MALEHAVSHRHEYDITTTYKINEPAQLSFKILTKDNVDAYKIGQIIEYDDKIFIVDKLDINRDDYSVTDVTCCQNAINLSKKICGKFEYIAETVQTLVDTVLEGTGWSLGRTDIPSNMKRHLITEEQTVLANLNTIAENFGAVLIFNYNTVDILMQKGEELILSDDVNLESISISKDGSDIITRLHCFGGVDKDTGIETSILDMTNGLTYIEDYSFFLEQGYSLAFIGSRPDLFLREAIYRNTDLYDSQALYNAGITQLKAQMYPQVTCKVNVINNGKPIHINMSAQIYDSETETHLSARVTEVTVNKDEPAVIQIELSNVVSYGSWISNVVTKVDRIDNVVNDVNKSWQDILEEAKNNATNLINENLSNGHVCVEKNAIFIGDQPEKENMKNVWILGLGGIGHSSTGVDGQVNVAMTMDGAIVADRITAGELNGAIIKAGSIKADALSVGIYEKFQQGINIGATNYIRNSGNFKDSTYWLGNVTCRETLLNCSGEVRNVTNIPLMGGEEYIYSATIITKTDMEITENNLILGYTAYQPIGIPQNRGLNDENLMEELPILITKSKTYETMQGNKISISFESSKTLKSLKLSINNGEDFNYEGDILGEEASFDLSHLIYGNYICQLVGKDENDNEGYSKKFIINITTAKKDSVIFSNIDIAKPYTIKANTMTRIFIKFKTRQDLNNGFIINPTINIQGDYIVKNVQWEKGNVASDWKLNISDVSEGTLNEARSIFNVEKDKILGRIENVEKEYATNENLNSALNSTKNHINQQIKEVSNEIINLKENIGDIALDGIIDEVELEIISKSIVSLNSEKIKVDTRFDSLYESIFLTGDAKSKLNEIKNTFNLKHTQLINKINEIAEDGLLDETEVAEFNKCTEQYQSALALLSKAFDDALKNISENMANNYTDTKFSEITLELNRISLSVGQTTNKLSAYEQTTDKKIGQIELDMKGLNLSVSKVENAIVGVETNNKTLTDEQIEIKKALQEAERYSEEALNKLSDISNDSKFTPVEKQSTKLEWEKIINEKNKIIEEADKLEVSTVSYQSAYNILEEYISPLLDDLTETSDISGGIFRVNFINYYNAKQDILNAISSALKDIADNAETVANDATATLNTVKSQISDIHMTVNSITSKVENIETKSTLNLLYNSDFSILNDTKDNFDGWEKEEGIKIDTETILLDGYPSYYFNVTKQTSNVWRSIFSPFISASVKQKFTASIYVYAENWDKLDKGGSLQIEYHNDFSRITFSSVDIDKDKTGWQRLVLSSEAPSGATKVRIRVFPNRNGSFNVSKPMLQTGSSVSGWQKGFNINDFTNRLKSAEQKITDSSIINTVKSSQTDGKNTFALTSTLEQTIDGFKFDIRNSGGNNLLRNGGFENDLKYWNPNQYPNYKITGGTPGYQSYSTKSLLIYGSRTNSGYFQSFSCIPGNKYYCSFMAMKDPVSPTNTTIGIEGIGGVNIDSFTWKQYSFEFTATRSSHVFIAYANNYGNFYIDNIMVAPGSIPTGYIDYSGELYNSTLKIDADGLRVDFEDGTYSTMGRDGFKYFIGGSGNAYCSLIYTGSFSVSSTFYGATMGIDLPKEFIGKNVKVLIFPVEYKCDAPFAVQSVMCQLWGSVNNSTGHFTIKYGCHVIDTTQSWNNKDVGMTVGYIAMA